MGIEKCVPPAGKTSPACGKGVSRLRETTFPRAGQHIPASGNIFRECGWRFPRQHCLRAYASAASVHTNTASVLMPALPRSYPPSPQSYHCIYAGFGVTIGKKSHFLAISITCYHLSITSQAGCLQRLTTKGDRNDTFFRKTLGCARVRAKRRSQAHRQP